MFFAIGHLLWFIGRAGSPAPSSPPSRVVAAKQFTGKSDAELESATLAPA